MKSVHKFSITMLSRDVIQELGNHCHAALLYLNMQKQFNGPVYKECWYPNVTEFSTVHYDNTLK